jgi:hypothetical protein
MKYFSYSQQDALAIRALIADNQPIDITSFGQLVGDGLMMDLSLLSAINDRAVKRCSEGENPESVELSESGAVYDALNEVSVATRDDVGFWRWVTIATLRPFLILRQEDETKEALGAGTNSADILAARMFLRARISLREVPGGTPDYSLLTELGPKNHDFLQSHVVRVSTGAETGLARAFIKSQTDDVTRISGEKLRNFVTAHISRIKLTTATFLMSESEADSFLAEQRQHFRSAG